MKKANQSFIESIQKKTSNKEQIFINPALLIRFQEVTTKTMKQQREVEEILKTIDRELRDYRNLEELAFKAGYTAGKIHERPLTGKIAQKHEDALMGILYARYELIRDLERGR